MVRGVDSCMCTSGSAALGATVCYVSVFVMSVLCVAAALTSLQVNGNVVVGTHVYCRRACVCAPECVYACVCVCVWTLMRSHFVLPREFSSRRAYCV